MQNPHVKYLKAPNGYFYLFYAEEGKLFCRSYAAGWTPPQKIAEQAAPIFSICQYENAVYLLYTTPEGALSLASSQDMKVWSHRPLLARAPAPERTKYFLLPTEHTLHIIYHLPTESTGIDSLVYSAYREGKWETPYQIDRFLPLGQTPFLARRLSREHLILYYRTGRSILSAREMLLEPHTMGSVTPLIQTPAPCADISIVNDSEKIHLLYLVRGMFRTQLVYQYKHTAAISTPRVLWEDNHCEQCLLHLEGKQLICMWTANGQPFRCTSENGGASFGAVERYTDAFPARCIKGELLGAADAAWNGTELFGYGEQGFLPAFLPAISTPAPKPPTAPVPHPAQAYTMQESQKQQIEELSLLLAQRSEEISAVNARWKAQTEQLEQELQRLRQENAGLRKKGEEAAAEQNM